MYKFIFTSQDKLRNFFQNNSLYLKNKSVLTIYENVYLENNIKFEGKVVIKNNSKISSNSYLKNCYIDQNNHIRDSSIIFETKIKKNNLIGPFCFIRNSIISNKNIIGAHVELARAKLKDNIKISHKAFIGDCFIDSDVIIGAGVVTCNYKNGKKYISKIRSNSLIGSGSLIIADVKIGSDCIIAAGSIVNKNIKKNTKLIQKRISFCTNTI